MKVAIFKLKLEFGSNVQLVVHLVVNLLAKMEILRGFYTCLFNGCAYNTDKVE